MKIKHPGQRDDENAIEYMRRVVSACDHEFEEILSGLPSVEAIVDFFALWEAYGTEFWTGILDCIAEGDCADKAFQFIAKHKLGKSWTNAVRRAMKSRVPVGSAS